MSLDPYLYPLYLESNSLFWKGHRSAPPHVNLITVNSPLKIVAILRPQLHHPCPNLIDALRI